MSSSSTARSATSGVERDVRRPWHGRRRRDSLAPFTRDRRMKGLIVEEGQPLLL